MPIIYNEKNKDKIKWDLSPSLSQQQWDSSLNILKKHIL